MATPNPVMDELVQLADHDRHPQALSLFCKEVQAKTFGQCSGSEMALLDVICQRILPQLLEQHVLWLINHTDLVHRMLALLTGAPAGPVLSRRHARSDRLAAVSGGDQRGAGRTHSTNARGVVPHRE
jgi:hypothetical protein